MGKMKSETRLIEQEKLLYVEVEQLRASLLLHDASLLFTFFSSFYFVVQAIKGFFVTEKREEPSYITRKKSIALLVHKKSILLFLSKTPYAWLIFLVRGFVRITATRKNTYFTDQQKSAFLIYGTTNAADMQSRSVQIARKLAEKNRVIYIEGVFDEGRSVGYRIIEESGQFVSLRLVAHKSPHLAYQKLTPKEIICIKKSLRLFYVSMLKRSHINTYIHHPFWRLFIPLRKNAFYFDHDNSFAHLHNAANHIIDAEKKLLKNALQITAPDTKLLRKKGGIVVKNGVDWEIFKNTSHMIQTCDVDLCWIKKPVMGFIGTLDERIDEVLLGKLASAFPTASIVLVGNTDYRPVIEVAEQYANIFPVGKQLYNKLPLFLQSFDILITPYKLLLKGSAVHPELPLYLASGKPIVATAYCGLTRNPFKKSIYFPTSHIEWTDAVAQALKEKKHSNKKHFRIALAKKLRWNINPFLKKL
ncbi:MAG: hypothetical protein V1922_03350 [bacterium]